MRVPHCPTDMGPDSDAKRLPHFLSLPTKPFHPGTPPPHFCSRPLHRQSGAHISVGYIPLPCPHVTHFERSPLCIIFLHSLPPPWCLLHLPSVLLPLNMAHFPVQEFINSYRPQGRLQVHFWIFIQWIQLKCWTRTLHSSSNFCLSKEKGQIK